MTWLRKMMMLKVSTKMSIVKPSMIDMYCNNNKFYVFDNIHFEKFLIVKVTLKVYFFLYLFFSLFIRVVLLVLFILYIHCLKKIFSLYL